MIMFDDLLVNRAYLNECHECYNNHNLLNLKYLQNVQKELVDKKDFLPLIVRRHLEEDYIIHLKNEGLLKGELYNKLSISRRLEDNDMVNEFIGWLKENDEYSNLLNKKAYKKLQKELSEIKKEYEGLELW